MLIGALEELGTYFIVTSIIGAASVLGGLELALHFSVKFADAKNAQKFKTTQRFIFSLIFVNSFFIFTSFLLFKFVFHIEIDFLFLAILALSSEALVNEYGRFLLNVGKINHISQRDLLRGLFMAIAIGSSLVIENTVVSEISITIFLFLNLGLFIGKAHKTSKHFEVADIKVWVTDIVSLSFFKDLVKSSAPQFIQNQILVYSVTIERLLITALAGLSFMGSYVFLFTMISALASLVCMPISLKVRKLIVANQTEWNDKNTFTQSILLFPKVLGCTTIICAAVIFLAPPLATFLGREVDLSALVLFSASFTAAVQYYLSFVSPLFSSAKNWITASCLTLIVYLPSGFILIYPTAFPKGGDFALIIVIGISIAHVIVRLWFFWDQQRKFIIK